MKFRAGAVGGIVTGIYLMAVMLLVFLKKDTLPQLGLNEIGDFLAGAFGPIAFLWLVLGYLQQGRELKISSDALRMQVVELKRSGEQQAHLVAVGREQITAQLAANNYERSRYEKTMNARLLFNPKGRTVTGSLFIQSFEIHNVGSDAFELEFLCKIPDHNFYGTYPVLKRDERVNMPVKFERVEEDYFSTLHCLYKTSDGRNIRFDVSLKINSNNQEISISPVVKAGDL